MSDMKTFTVRDLDRFPRTLLQACRADGKARIRERNGKCYLITPEAPAKFSISKLPNFAERRAKLFRKTLSKNFAREFDRTLVGE